MNILIYTFIYVGTLEAGRITHVFNSIVCLGCMNSVCIKLCIPYTYV